MREWANLLSNAPLMALIGVGISVLGGVLTAIIGRRLPSRPEQDNAAATIRGEIRADRDAWKARAETAEKALNVAQALALTTDQAHYQALRAKDSEIDTLKRHVKDCDELVDDLQQRLDGKGV